VPVTLEKRTRGGPTRRNTLGDCFVMRRTQPFGCGHQIPFTAPNAAQIRLAPKCQVGDQISLASRPPASAVSVFQDVMILHFGGIGTVAGGLQLRPAPGFMLDASLASSVPRGRPRLARSRCRKRRQMVIATVEPFLSNAYNASRLGRDSFPAKATHRLTPPGSRGVHGCLVLAHSRCLQR
jgi:hypothetical protein